MKLINYVKKATKNLKNPYWKAKSKYIKYYETLEINEKAILLESQSAIKISGNPFYILRYLLTDEKYAGYTVYLCLMNKYINSMRGLLEHYKIDVNLVICTSDEYMRLLASAKYLITDATFPNYWIKKEGQVYINTWHGTPLKTMGRKVHNDVFFGNIQKNLVNADYMLFPNTHTKDVMIRDYMLENISSGSYIFGGYPRNTIFFDKEAERRTRDELGLKGKRIYAYMPTWRGIINKIGTSKNDAYLIYYLCELDKRLADDEVLYINIHPLAKNAKNVVDTSGLKHIKNFPSEYETYDFLNIADVLVTDYSSVFFDYACTRKKIVLFPYDKDDYLRDRGMYIDMDSLPFPQVFDLDGLIAELRSEKNYDDTEFVKSYCTWDSIDATARLCDRTILGIDTGLTVEPILNNGKENILIYAGALDKNGITASLRSLVNSIDLDKRNYYLSFCQKKAKNHGDSLATFNEKVNFFAIAEYFNLTIADRVIRRLYKKHLISTNRYMKKLGGRIQQDFSRTYGGAKFDAAIQFCGYENDIIALYSQFQGPKSIWVHNDMLAEIKTRKNQQASVLKYAYRNYNHVVTVSEDIIEPTVCLAGRADNVTTVHNVIDYKTILERSREPLILDEETRCSVSEESLVKILASDKKKFINVGRFSPEKGQVRLVNAFYRLWKENPDTFLIIMGGNNKSKGYEELTEKIAEMGLENNVILLLAVSNPYPIIKACDYFIMSSFYEGLPMTLFEADVLGLPIASTDVRGPHSFLTKYKGTLVEDSEDGVYRGLELLYNGKVKTLDIDYEAYNQKCVAEFESLLVQS